MISGLPQKKVKTGAAKRRPRSRKKCFCNDFFLENITKLYDYAIPDKSYKTTLLDFVVTCVFYKTTFPISLDADVKIV